MTAGQTPLCASLNCGLGYTPALSVTHCASTVAVCGLWRYISAVPFQSGDSTSHVEAQRRDVTATPTEQFTMDDDDRSSTAVASVHSAAKSNVLSSIPTVSVDSGDFCFVTEQDVTDTQLERRKLRDGFHWQKQLVFRSKLTMHTAFERKDNKDPAAVTALAVSR